MHATIMEFIVNYVFIQSGGTLFLSIDGLFGLCRKKNAGKSVRDPLHNGKLFEDQAVVDSFVAQYPQLSNEQTMVIQYDATICFNLACTF